jgi:hypothetical protein
MSGFEYFILGIGYCLIVGLAWRERSPEFHMRLPDFPRSPRSARGLSRVTLRRSQPPW